VQSWASHCTSRQRTVFQCECCSHMCDAVRLNLQELQDPGSAELGLILYQLATTYYSHDMLQDAGPALQRASALLRTHYPPEHDLVRGLVQGGACPGVVSAVQWSGHTAC
jgi:hypothetical protein